MSLIFGTRLGSYEIKDSLGVGEMGEVYRARDTKLHRDVAIKVLPDVFAGDPDRLARFEREAHTLAALNHPNIAQICMTVPRAGRRKQLLGQIEMDAPLYSPPALIGDALYLAAAKRLCLIAAKF